MGRRQHTRGFTLMELMVAVAVIGILASIAIPAYGGYLQRSRATEAPIALAAVYRSAAAYYAQQRATTRRLRNSAVVTHCTVGRSAAVPRRPSAAVQVPNFEGDAAFHALGHDSSSAVRYSYQILGRSRCSTPANRRSVYTFRARGDLDGDGRQSTYEVAAGTNRQGSLLRSNLYVLNGLE